MLVSTISRPHSTSADERLAWFLVTLRLPSRSPGWLAIVAANVTRRLPTGQGHTCKSKISNEFKPSVQFLGNAAVAHAQRNSRVINAKPLGALDKIAA